MQNVPFKDIVPSEPLHLGLQKLYFCHETEKIGPNFIDRMAFSTLVLLWISPDLFGEVCAL